MRPSQGLEIKVGLLIILGIVATVVMIMISDKLSLDRFYHVQVYLDDAAGLRNGSPVTLSGITVGNVVAIETSDESLGAIHVDVRLRQSVRIPNDASLTLASSGIFGDSFLAFSIHDRLSRPYLPTDGSAKVKAMPSFLGEAAEQAKNILRTLSGVLDDATRDDTKQLIHNASLAAAELARDVHDQNQRLGVVLDNLQVITTDLKTTSASFAKHSDAITQHLDATLTTVDERVRGISDNVDVTVAKLGAIATQVDRLLQDHRQDLDVLITRMRDLSIHAANIAGAIDAGHGLVGQLVFSRDLARDIDSAVVDLTVASQMLNQHPSSLVWGASKKEQAEARAERDRLLLERKFHEDFGLPPPPTGDHDGRAGHPTEPPLR